MNSNNFIDSAHNYYKSVEQQNSGNYDSMEKFLNQEIPSNKSRGWKYTNLNFLKEYSFSLLKSSNSVDEFVNSNLISDEYYKVLVIDGKLVSTTDSNGFKISSGRFSNNDSTNNLQNSFIHLNQALSSNGYIININESAKIETHLYIINVVSQPKVMCNLQNIVNVSKGASATIIEHYISLHDYSFRNSQLKVNLEEDSVLNYYTIIDDLVGSINYNMISFNQQASSTVNNFNLHLCSGWTKNDIEFNQYGEGAESISNGISFSGYKEKVYNNIAMKSFAKNCSSKQGYRMVVDSNGEAGFIGDIYVDRDCSGANATQSNHNLLLSNKAKVYSEPNLEILTDDVICSHGVTTGHLSEDDIFYLQSRGLNESEIKRLLIYGFLNSSLECIGLGDLHSWSYNKISCVLEKGYIRVVESEN